MPSESASQLRLAVGAIVKNEAPYILEWVAYHRVLGIDRFCIADNASNDGTSELLTALAFLGLVDYIAFPGRRGRPPQLPAYSRIMRRMRRSADWIAFIDADEFIVPTDGAPSLSPFFSALDENVGAVILNWAIYGSSFRVEPSEGPVIERFTRRAGEKLLVNHHYKTVLRCRAFYDVGSNPHFFVIRNGYRTIQADGRELTNHPMRGAGISDRIVWTPLRINHYVVKSRAEFDRKKAPRGRATVLNTFRDDSFFVRHDRNDFEDAMPGWLVDATRAGVETLKQRLRAIGLAEHIVSADLSIATLKPSFE